MANDSVVTLILAGGRGAGLDVLTALRTESAVPFAGKYRIIDFALSNCANSGLYDVTVLTQYRPLSLHDHIGSGGPWDLDRMRGGVRVVSPYTGRPNADWNRGTADAVNQNIGELQESAAALALILAGDHIYKMDYRPLIAQHRQTRADVTIGVVRVPIAQASRFGIVTTDTDKRITAFHEKPTQPEGDLASMGIYVFDKKMLIERVQADAANTQSRHDFGRNILPRMIAEGDRVYAYEFHDYWRDVGTVEAYWEASMGLVTRKPELDLYNRSWVIYTRSEERPPAFVSPEAQIVESFVAHGCQIRGTVIHSVLSPGVIIGAGAVVRDSVIMTDAVIGPKAVIERAIIDKEVNIGANSSIGVADDADDTRITVVGKRATTPEGQRIGRGSRIKANATPADFLTDEAEAPAVAG